MKVHFDVVPLWSILVCKIPQFLAKKRPIRTTNHILLEGRHSEATEKLYYVLSTTHSSF